MVLMLMHIKLILHDSEKGLAQFIQQAPFKS